MVSDDVVEFIDAEGGNSIGLCFGWISTLDGEDGESTWVSPGFENVTDGSFSYFAKRFLRIYNDSAKVIKILLLCSPLLFFLELVHYSHPQSFSYSKSSIENSF